MNLYDICYSLLTMMGDTTYPGAKSQDPVGRPIGPWCTKVQRPGDRDRRMDGWGKPVGSGTDLPGRQRGETFMHYLVRR
jgi:hypothetical protein